MGNVWMLVPLLPIVVAIVVAAAFVRAIALIIPQLQNFQGTTPPASLGASVGSLIVGAYAIAIVAGYALLFLLSLALYYLIDRRNGHFRRQQLLFTTLIKYLETKHTSDGSRSSRLAQLCEDAEFEEQERPAGVWAILNLFATPIASLVVASNLTQDLSKHDARQVSLEEALIGAFTEAGIASPSLGNTKTRRRDPMLFLLLTIITAGLFWIYWFYTLLRDFNEHFANQDLFEDRILAALKPATHEKKCAACGGSVPLSAKYCPFCGAAQNN
jgi:hypothetical protein